MSEEAANRESRLLTRVFHRTFKSGDARVLMTGAGVGGVIMLTNKALAFGTAVIFARLLGAEGYGIYGFAIALMGMLGVVIETGLPVLLVREVARAHARLAWDEIRALRRAAFWLTGQAWLIVALVGGMILLVPDLPVERHQRLTIALMLILLPLNSCQRILGAILNGLRRVIAAQSIESLYSPLLMFAGAATLVIVGASGLLPQHVITLQIGSAIVGLSIAAVHVQRAVKTGLPAHSARLDPGALRRRGLPFLMINSAMLFNLMLDTVLVNLFLGNAATGIYRVASQGALLALFGNQIVTSVAMPYFARLHAIGDRANLRRVYGHAAWAGFAFAIVVLLVFLQFGSWIIAATFGQEYVSAQDLLVVLSAGYAANLFFGPAGVLMGMCGHERANARILWFTAGINLVGSTLAILQFGAIGAAAMTAITSALYQGLSYRAARKMEVL